MHNGRLIAMAQSTSADWNQRSQTVVLKVSTSDEVWISNRDFSDQFLDGQRYTVFSGALLYQI
ncbi:hypothetical protein DPMN_026440 [Dreissena polymorpha]|uniref:C1q domain-containing protein n=1 Tax=Dreissena polymorpha TaxID=45954 RepID=A0A9D4LSY3_DREPO|nr:hypothetical protein DPMN_026440 [Dreissena polymorpha]